MTQEKDKTDGMKWKKLTGGQEDLRPSVREVIQQVLEVEMEEVVEAGKRERTTERVRCYAGYYGRTLVFLLSIGQANATIPGDSTIL